VGAGTGAAIGAVASSGDDNFGKFDQAATAGLTVVGAIAGALTGYLIGRHSSKRVLVYEAGRP
jgi:membrane protein DedA with SNARE-associated domain